MRCQITPYDLLGRAKDVSAEEETRPNKEGRPLIGRVKDVSAEEEMRPNKEGRPLIG